MREYFMCSARLGFGHWHAHDLPLALGLWGDPQVTTLTGGPFTPAQVAERLAREIHHQQVYGFQYWPLFDLRTDEHVGCCGLQPRAPALRICELGYQLRADRWGQRYAQEAGETVIAQAFGTLGLTALFAGHHPDNARSRRVLEALGFEYTHHEVYPPSGEMEPAYLLRREAVMPPRSG